MQKTIPTWVTVVSSLIAALGLFVGGSLYISPGTFIPGINFADPGPAYLAEMWAARQIAIGAVVAYALFRRSSPMLRISLLVYCIMNVQDAGIGLVNGNMSLFAGALFFTVLSATLMFVLSRAARGEAGDTRGGEQRP